MLFRSVDLRDTPAPNTKELKAASSKKSNSGSNATEDSSTDKAEHIWLKEINQAHWCKEHKEADYVVPLDGRHEKFTIEQLSQWAFLCVC